jgi:hypothetical protein
MNSTADKQRNNAIANRVPAAYRWPGEAGA